MEDEHPEQPRRSSRRCDPGQQRCPPPSSFPLPPLPVAARNGVWCCRSLSRWLTVSVLWFLSPSADGLVVLTGALGAMDETPDMISYGLAKAAVHHLVISYPDGLPNGADICAILPGVIDTPNNRSNMPDANFAEWTQPADIAEEVVRERELTP